MMPADKKVNGVPVKFFRTYVGAARKAYQGGLIGEAELMRVVQKAQSELAGVSKDDLKWADLTRLVPSMHQIHLFTSAMSASRNDCT